MPSELQRLDVGGKEIAAASTMMQSLHIADWLGPLAPVAISPFFGLACLSGLSIWGPDWLAENVFLSAASQLRSGVVFGVFLALALLTSVPRFFKVSKPFAQAMDQIESYSVIVIVLVIKLFADVGETSEGMPVAVVQFGVFSFTAQTMLAIAMVINLFVINSVKFFFEVLIWLTPIPAVDAMFEITTKAVCAALIALYAFSPTIATLINLAMLFAALIVFRWVWRRMTFYRSILMDLFLPRIWRAYGRPSSARLYGFVKQGDAPFKSKARWRLTREGDSWQLCPAGLLMSGGECRTIGQRPTLDRGWIMHTLVVKLTDGQTVEFHVSRRYDGAVDQLQRLLDLELAGEVQNTSADVATMRSEFA
jgi:hypothetical protein